MSNVKIALLRGINVGGHKKFLKADQLQMLTALGFKDAQVYLHTGNWVFSSSETASEISTMIASAITNKYGWQVPVLVFDASEFKRIFNVCPFSEATKEKSYFTLLAARPAEDNVAVLRAISYSDETFVITDTCVYLYPANGASKAKLNNNLFEKKLKVTATTRNYKTMAKLVSMATS